MPLKSEMTLNRSLWRTAQQVSDFAARRNQTLVEYRQGFVYCYPKSDIADIFSDAPDGQDIVAIYNCKDAFLWRKKSESSSRPRYAA
jgi:hypothetical protein